MVQRFGRYETIHPVASGGMATVYVGRAVGAGGFERRVAIKVMHPHIADDPDFVKMFLDEARLAARIHHPNVVSTLDVQKTEDAMFLVMELVQGASLAQVLRRLKKQKQRMPLGVALRIMLDALAGLHAAHELTGKDEQPLHLVHRDVSPHNILVGADGICKLTDFGVARAQSRLSTTRGGQLKGKLSYMAPEQATGGELDRRADVYAAGLVMWETLTGRRCFKAEHDAQILAMVLEGVARSPRELVRQIPALIDAVCMKALALDPRDRFESAAAFLVALENAAEQTDVRLPSTRQLAAFVQEFKVELKSLPPPEPSLDSADPVKGDVEPKSDSKQHSFPEAWVPPSLPSGALSEPTVGSVSNGGASQLTGIGAVHSRPPRELRASRTGIFVVTAALLVLCAIGVLAWLSGRPGGDGSSRGAASAGSATSSDPTLSETSTNAAPLPAASAEPSASVAASASAAASGAPDVAASSAPDVAASAGPGSSALVSRSSLVPRGTTPPPPPARPAGATKKGPLGFEPDDL